MAQPTSPLQRWILEWQRELLARAEPRAFPGQREEQPRPAFYSEK